MKTFLSLLTVAIFSSFHPGAKSIYDFKIKSLDGSTIDFSKFKGNIYRIPERFLDSVSLL